MTPIEHIRTRLFGMSQNAFANVAGTTQPTVSRWEKGELDPGLFEMGRIRSAAKKRGLPWDDRLFFDAPEQSKALQKATS